MLADKDRQTRPPSSLPAVTGSGSGLHHPLGSLLTTQTARKTDMSEARRPWDSARKREGRKGKEGTRECLGPTCRIEVGVVDESTDDVCEFLRTTETLRSDDTLQKVLRDTVRHRCHHRCTEDPGRDTIHTNPDLRKIPSLPGASTIPNQRMDHDDVMMVTVGRMEGKIQTNVVIRRWES